MNDHSKKKNNSFRKLFPNLFFSHKSKDKSVDKDGHNNLKGTWKNSPKINRYENPRSLKCDRQGVNDNNFYENLSIAHRSHKEDEIVSSSNHSSSSTLVSESVKNKSYNNYSLNESDVSRRGVDHYPAYTARPQVPPKPYNEMTHSPPNRRNLSSTSCKPRYPDVYYHSIEKLRDKISPLEEIEIYKASQEYAAPAPVGAEIKKVSTKFLISPKKEAEVRTIQPTRARSLSLDKSGEQIKQNGVHRDKTQHSKKSYNYSAPTSPLPTAHKIPSMPATVSPYEHVRKNIMETEEKRNSLSRSSTRNKSTPSPKSQDTYERTQSPARTPQQEYAKLSDVQKETARQKVEAFYWQKLKELKQKEDEYYLRQSLYSSVRSPARSTSQSNSNCSTPNSLVVIEPRSYSLPRGKDPSQVLNQQKYPTSPFIRGAPERRTDTFIQTRSSQNDHDIVLRNPEKFNFVSASLTSTPAESHQIPIYEQKGSLPRDYANNLQNKRVSFEDQYSQHAVSEFLKSERKEKNYIQFNDKDLRPYNTSSNNDNPKGSSRAPPLPPVRTTSYGSVVKSVKVNNKKTLQGTRGIHSIYSESESGSEAGEIQRIMQSSSRKGNPSQCQGDL